MNHRHDTLNEQLNCFGVRRAGRAAAGAGRSPVRRGFLSFFCARARLQSWNWKVVRYAAILSTKFILHKFKGVYHCLL